MLKILFKNRIDTDTMSGGDSIQMYNTKRELEKLGVKVDVTFSPQKSSRGYDIVHVFNIMRPFEATLAINEAKRNNVKIVFSSIYWDFSEYNSIGRDSKFHSLLSDNLSEFSVEKLKDIVRFYNGNINKLELFKYIVSDYKNTLSHVDLFLPNSIGEGELIRNKILSDARYSPIYNAVDADKFKLLSISKNRKGSILAARIDPRKNILSLVKAIKKYPLDIYGKVAENHQEYFKEIKENSSSLVSFKGFLDSSLLPEIYNKYIFHIMPSWLETPGLSQLEAAACGCNIITSNRGSTNEYFGNMATYCDPSSIESISDALHFALDNMKTPKEMSEFILDTYIWKNTAEQTLSAYKMILGD
ncbi:glycosyltransferase [Photobacterium aquimaris]|uniref:Glycosyltransferase Gtf1 n=1 Tax=Photobacterium aquimaris TaxID=512643 RepID=A0A1Y6KXV4_9GAMM|nr:glycosyltransferase [Photobacterium aquimaris]SMY17003.1 Glycosyltransferase Gtf1 [Photobacterium aquimaris]